MEGLEDVGSNPNPIYTLGVFQPRDLRLEGLEDRFFICQRINNFQALPPLEDIDNRVYTDARTREHSIPAGKNLHLTAETFSRHHVFDLHIAHWPGS